MVERQKEQKGMTNYTVSSPEKRLILYVTNLVKKKKKKFPLPSELCTCPTLVLLWTLENTLKVFILEIVMLQKE